MFRKCIIDSLKQCSVKKHSKLPKASARTNWHYSETATAAIVKGGILLVSTVIPCLQTQTSTHVCCDNNITHKKNI